MTERKGKGENTYYLPKKKAPFLTARRNVVLKIHLPPSSLLFQHNEAATEQDLKPRNLGKTPTQRSFHLQESLWVTLAVATPPPKKTPEMPVFERWAGWGTLSKTKREMQVDHKGNRWAGGKGNSNSTLFQMSFTQLHRTNILFNCVWGRLHNLNLDLMTIMWKFLSNSYHNFTTYTCTDIWPLFYNINPLN